MVKSYDWSCLENQLHQLQDLQLQEKGSGSADPPMDVTSVITQVAREAEHHSLSDNSSKGNSVRNSIRKKGNPEKQNGAFRSMLCCFGRPRRKRNLTSSKIVQENQTVLSNGTTGCTPPPTPPLANKNLPASETPSFNGEQKYLLPPRPQYLKHKKCAVIDLDETLVHSSFKPISNADFIVPVEIDGTIHQVYVLKRPHVDIYLQRMGELYECVLFTASLAKYADPVADLLDKQGVFTSRLFRESCVFHNGNYVKDLSLIGRDLNKVIIIDNSPASYIFHPDNAVPVISWFDDPSDRELLDILPCLEEIAKSDDVYSVLRSNGFTSQAQETTSTIQQAQQTRNVPGRLLSNLTQNDDDDESEECLVISHHFDYAMRMDDCTPQTLVGSTSGFPPSSLRNNWLGHFITQSRVYGCSMQYYVVIEEN